MIKCFIRFLILFLVVVVSASEMPGASAQILKFSNNLNKEQSKCLAQLLQISDWSYSPRFHSEMMTIAEVATTTLNNGGRTDYVYLFEADGWCGTAGCPLLIGEVQPKGACHLLYDETGDKSFTVLRRRDYGYRRIYAPCEARFDGRQYQQVREECPNPDVHH